MLSEEGLGPPMTPSTCFLSSYSCTCPCQPPHLSKGDTDPHRASWLQGRFAQVWNTMSSITCQVPITAVPNTPRPFRDDPGQQNCFVPPWGVVSLDAALGLSKNSPSGTLQYLRILLRTLYSASHVSCKWGSTGGISLCGLSIIPVLLLRSCFCLIHYLLLLLHIVMINSCSSPWPHFRITSQKSFCNIKMPIQTNKSGPLGRSLGVFLRSSPESLRQRQSWEWLIPKNPSSWHLLAGSSKHVGSCGCCWYPLLSPDTILTFRSHFPFCRHISNATLSCCNELYFS